MLTEGLNLIRDLIDTDIDVGELGTGTTQETPIDTGLQTAIASTSGSGTSISSVKTARQTIKTYSANSAIGNTNEVSEFALRRSTSPITDFNRVTFSAVTKDSNTALQIDTRFFVTSLF